MINTLYVIAEQDIWFVLILTRKKCLSGKVSPYVVVHISAQTRGVVGFWSDLQWNTERTKYLVAVPNPRYRTSHVQADWEKLVRTV